jgi:hypothetical protein
MPSERKLNVSLSMKIKDESTSVKVLPWDPFATFNVAMLIHSCHENSIVGINHMATHCRKLIVTDIYQANSYQQFVMSY